jgi:GTP-binding protein
MSADTSFVIKKADFLFGVPSVEKTPPQRFSEIAVVGRSNVGKSTLINRLLAKKTARVSSRPGCTLEINYYGVEGEKGNEEFRFTLVDLPGFGFAKVSKLERERISNAIVRYIQERKQLQAVLLLNDSRRPAGEDELAVRDICAEMAVPVIVVATKIDTLNQSEKIKCTRSLAQSYYLEVQDVVFAGEKTSPTELWDRILPFIEHFPD